MRPIHEILVADPNDRRLARIRRMAVAADTPLRRATHAEIDGLAGGRTHGGALALVGPRRYLDLDALLAATGPRALLVMLDGVEDPFNFGQAIRALHAAGVDGLIVRPRSWETAAGIVARASAGASELLPTAVADSADVAAQACRTAGLRIVCAASTPEATPLHEMDLTSGTLMVIGGERRGFTRTFVASADLVVRIPYGRDGAPPLGTAAAAAVIGFEALRQRRAGSTSASNSRSNRARARVGER